MIKFLKKILIFTLTIFITALIVNIIVIKIVPSQFDDMYQTQITNKYNLLVSENKQKVIYISGSSGAFCVNAKKIQDEIGLPFINLGLHAGLGIELITELSKANIRKGDLVLIAHEEDLYYSSLDYYQNGLFLSGINDNLQMLLYLPKTQYKSILSYYPKYIFTKLDRFFFGYETLKNEYSNNSFDQYGSMNVEIIGEHDCDARRRKIELSKEKFNDETINYIYKFKKYVESQGATPIIVYPFISADAILSSDEEIAQFSEYLTTKTGVSELYSLKESIIDEKYLYDTIYHCNTNGQTEFTNLLIDKLEKYIKENNL